MPDFRQNPLVLSVTSLVFLISLGGTLTWYFWPENVQTAAFCLSHALWVPFFSEARSNTFMHTELPDGTTFSVQKSLDRFWIKGFLGADTEQELVKKLNQNGGEEILYALNQKLIDSGEKDFFYSNDFSCSFKKNKRSDSTPEMTTVAAGSNDTPTSFPKCASLTNDAQEAVRIFANLRDIAWLTHRSFDTLVAQERISPDIQTFSDLFQLFCNQRNISYACSNNIWKAMSQAEMSSKAKLWMQKRCPPGPKSCAQEKQRFIHAFIHNTKDRFLHLVYPAHASTKFVDSFSSTTPTTFKGNTDDASIGCTTTRLSSENVIQKKGRCFLTQQETFSLFLWSLLDRVVQNLEITLDSGKICHSLPELALFFASRNQAVLDLSILEEWTEKAKTIACNINFPVSFGPNGLDLLSVIDTTQLISESMIPHTATSFDRGRIEPLLSFSAPQLYATEFGSIQDMLAALPADQLPLQDAHAFPLLAQKIYQLQALVNHHQNLKSSDALCVFPQGFPEP